MSFCSFRICSCSLSPSRGNHIYVCVSSAAARCLEILLKPRLKMATNRVLVHLMLSVFLVHKIEGQGPLKDVRLVNGTMPNEGIIIYTEDCITWETTCGNTYLAISDVIVFCRHLGFAGANRAIKKPPFGGPFDTLATTYTDCGTGEGDITSCTLSVSGCSGSPGGAVCHGSNYLGCFIDSTSNRVLDGPKNTSVTGLTSNKCLEFCREYDEMVFAGVELGEECYCGNGASNISKHSRVSDSECNYQCDGSPTESCGGSNRIAIFNITMDPDYSPSPMYSCDKTTPKISMASSKMVQPTLSPGNMQNSSGISGETPTTFIGLIGTESNVTTVTPAAVPSATYQTTPSPSPGTYIALYAGIGGGVAGLVLLCIIITVLVCRCKSRPKEDGHYDMKNLPPLGNKSPVGYENAIVNFPEVPLGATLPRDIKKEQGGKVAKDAFTAQMKRGTMLVEYINIEKIDRSKLRNQEPDSGLHVIYQNKDNHDASSMVEDANINEKNRPKVAPKPDAALRVSYQNKAGGSINKQATRPKVPNDLEGLYAMSTKNRTEPDGGDSGDLYAMPDKGRKSKMSYDTSVQPEVDTADDQGSLYAMHDKNRAIKTSLSGSVEPQVDASTEDEGDLYAMPDKNRKSKLSPSVPVLTGDADAMYAMPDKSRFKNVNDGDSTEMVENELYGSPSD